MVTIAVHHRRQSEMVVQPESSCKTWIEGGVFRKRQAPINPSPAVDAGAYAAIGPDRVGQVGNLRPIGNRPDNTFSDSE
jgi:hypothetical protein